MWPEYAETIFLYRFSSLKYRSQRIVSLYPFETCLSGMFLSIGSHIYTHVLLWAALDMCLTWTVRKERAFEV